jgi:hypothetical protein
MSTAMHSEPVCANCRIVIRWQPTIVGDKLYCCPGCAQGGPCECDYDNLPQPGRTNALVLQKARTVPQKSRDGGQASPPDAPLSETGQEWDL